MPRARSSRYSRVMWLATMPAPRGSSTSRKRNCSRDASSMRSSVRPRYFIAPAPRPRETRQDRPARGLPRRGHYKPKRGGGRTAASRTAVLAEPEIHPESLAGGDGGAIARGRCEDHRLTGPLHRGGIEVPAAGTALDRGSPLQLASR